MSVPNALLKTRAQPGPELRIPGAAAQTRVVSMSGIRLGPRESARSFRGIICDDISEFESFSIGAGGCQALSDCSVDLVWDARAGTSLLLGIATLALPC